jgi:hypothetical protein
MDEQPTPHGTRLSVLVDTAVTPATADRSALLRLTAALWPGRDDRTVPVGRHWVRQWGPRPMHATPHECAATGRPCGYCN